MKAWNVFNSTGKKIDVVFFADSLDSDYVKNSLTQHDNFEATIVVKLRKAKKS